MGKRPTHKSVKETDIAAEANANQEIETLPLSFESPESSAIAGASYDPGSQTLTVLLKDDGRTLQYDYAGVEDRYWREFLEARSKGRYFQGSIRPNFIGRRRS